MRTLTTGDQALLGLSGDAGAEPPPSIASTVAVWWASDLELVDGDPVSTWVDRVNGVTVSQTGSARPTFDADGAAGHPTVNFDGGDWLGMSSALSSGQSGCVVAVAQIADPLEGQSLWSQGVAGSTTRYLLGTTRYSTGGQIESQQRNNDVDDVVRGSTAVPANTLVALEWSSAGTSYQHRLDNVAQTMTASNGFDNGDWFGDITGTNLWTIGGLRYSPPVGLLVGRIALLVVLDAQLSVEDRAALYGWISGYYGVGA